MKRINTLKEALIKAFDKYLSEKGHAFINKNEDKISSQHNKKRKD